MEMAKYSADDFKACTVTVRKSSHNFTFYAMDLIYHFLTKLYSEIWLNGTDSVSSINRE